MNTRQRHLISDLMRKYSTHGTESLIAYVAETNDMLEACKALLHSLAASGTDLGEWLQQECAELGVPARPFLKEIEHIVILFAPDSLEEDHFTVLGLPATASLEEIKKAYRTLSRKYHPDTASTDQPDTATTFIAISKAYQALMQQHTLGQSEQPKERDWRRKKGQKFSSSQKRQLFLWMAGLLLLLIVVSSIATINIQRKAMLAGLQESRGAFIPPTKNSSAEKRQETSPTRLETSVPAQKPLPQAEEPKVAVVEPPPTSLVAISAAPKTSPSAASTPEKAFVASGEKTLPPRELAAAEIHERNTPQLVSPGEAEPSRKSSRAERRAKEGQARGEEKQTSIAVIEQHTGVAVPVPHQAPLPVTQATAPEPEKIPSPREVAKHSTSALLAKATIEPTKIPQVAPAEQPPQGLASSGYVSSTHPTAITTSNAAAPTPEKSKTDPQARVDRFFADYTTAYEQRNLILFSRFFDGNATENGKAFASVMPVYLDLFAATSRLSFHLEQQTTRYTREHLVIDGTFKVVLHYSDGRKISGSGPIHFLLSDSGTNLLIKEMNYEFHAD